MCVKMPSSSRSAHKDIRFHSTIHGSNIKISSFGKRAASIDPNNTANNFTITSSPISPSQHICIKFKKFSTSDKFTFGLTTLNPNKLNTSSSFFDSLKHSQVWYGTVRLIPDKKQKKHLYICILQNGILATLNETLKYIKIDKLNTQQPLFIVVFLPEFSVVKLKTGINSDFDQCNASRDLSFFKFHPAGTWCKPLRTMPTLNQSGYSFYSTCSATNIRFTLQIPCNNCAVSIGFTSLAPDSANSKNLPENCDELSDRKEYWVVVPQFSGLKQRDVIVLDSYRDGKIHFGKNGASEGTIYVDYSVELFLFVRVLQGGVQNVSVYWGNAPREVVKSAPPLPPESTEAVGPASAKSGESENDECTICCENQIDSVIYNCGHMSMCFECAENQWRREGGGYCPLCRASIKDVIRVYKT